MATIPPLVAVSKTRHTPAEANWLTFNLIFVLGLSGLVNILLLIRLATLAIR